MKVLNLIGLKESIRFILSCTISDMKGHHWMNLKVDQL